MCTRGERAASPPRGHEANESEQVCDLSPHATAAPHSGPRKQYCISISCRICTLLHSHRERARPKPAGRSAETREIQQGASSQNISHYAAADSLALFDFVRLWRAFCLGCRGCLVMVWGGESVCRGGFVCRWGSVRSVRVGESRGAGYDVRKNISHPETRIVRPCVAGARPNKSLVIDQGLHRVARAGARRCGSRVASSRCSLWVGMPRRFPPHFRQSRAAQAPPPG